MQNQILFIKKKHGLDNQFDGTGSNIDVVTELFFG